MSGDDRGARGGGPDDGRGEAGGARGGGARSGRGDAGGQRPIFTIQLHAATTLHYDFRLEVDGVLRSWAVPKGPSLEPSEKRLAVQVPDHALDYAGFEGRIGGGYGKGAVIVWDRGTYRALTDGDFGEALDSGHASFWLEGEKLQGGWTLQRTSAGAKPQWLLIKRRDEHAGDDAPSAASVLSGRTIEELQGEGGT